jgi:hypothetical protein
MTPRGTKPSNDQTDHAPDDSRQSMAKYSDPKARVIDNSRTDPDEQKRRA